MFVGRDEDMQRSDYLLFFAHAHRHSHTHRDKYEHNNYPNINTQTDTTQHTTTHTLTHREINLNSGIQDSFRLQQQHLDIFSLKNQAAFRNNAKTLRTSSTNHLQVEAVFTGLPPFNMQSVSLVYLHLTYSLFHWSPSIQHAVCFTG